MLFSFTLAVALLASTSVIAQETSSSPTILPTGSETSALSDTSALSPSAIGSAISESSPNASGTGQEPNVSASATDTGLPQESTVTPLPSALASEEPTPVTTTAFPVFTDKNDAWVANFLADITIGYQSNTSDYLGADGLPLPLNRTQFNVTGLRCDTLYQDIYGLRLSGEKQGYDRGIGVFRYFNSCMAVANFIYDRHDDISFPDGFEEDVLTPYVVPNISTPAMLLAKNISQFAGNFLYQTCYNIDCAEGYDNPNESPCSNLYKRNNYKFNKGNNHRLPGNSPLDRPILSHSNVMACQKQICSRFQVLNVDDPDIGGVGVFLSYVFQIIFAAVLMLCSGIDWFHCIFADKQRKNKKTFYFHSEPFVGLVVNFQKSQVFFSGALAVAAFVKSQNFSIGTLDDYLLLIICINGITLISFNLVSIYLLSRRDWYLYFLSAGAYLVCLVFAVISFLRLPTQVKVYNDSFYFCWDWFKTKDFIGGSENTEDLLKSLLTYGPYGKLPGTRAIIITIFCWCTAIMVGSLGHQLKIHKTFPANAKLFWMNWPRPRLLDIVVGILVCAVYGGIMLLNMVALSKFWRLINHTEWSFGQIIAVTIWVPVFFDYFADQYQENRKNRREKQERKERKKQFSGSPALEAGAGAATEKNIARAEANPSSPVEVKST